MVAPDQPIELRILLAEGERKRLLLHQRHRLGLAAEGQVGARAIVPNEARHFSLALRPREAFIGQYVVQLAVQQVRPVEHHLRLRGEPRIHRLDSSLLERDAGRLDQHLLRELIVATHLKLFCRGIGKAPQRFIEDRVAEIERVEHAIRVLVVRAKGPVVRGLQVELLVGGAPLRPRRLRCGERKQEH